LTSSHDGRRVSVRDYDGAVCRGCLVGDEAHRRAGGRGVDDDRTVSPAAPSGYAPTMERVRSLSRDEAPADARPFYDRDESAFGLILNPTTVMAHRPPILAASKQLSRSVSVDATLPADLRALVCVRVATLVGCPF
jgi:hypothetical protein